MNNTPNYLDYSPIEEFKNIQLTNQNISNNNFIPSSYQMYPSSFPKFDHAYILQNYRKLRVQQRQQVMKLKIPQNLKDKFFGRPIQDTEYMAKSKQMSSKKPSQLVIFNHPFKGRIVMTKADVAKQLQRESKNAKKMDLKNFGNQSMSEDILNDMAPHQDTLKLKMMRLHRDLKSQQGSQKEQKQIHPNQKLSYKQIAQKINQQRQRKEDKIYFIHKDAPQDKNTLSKRDEKQWKIRDEKMHEFSKGQGLRNVSQQRQRDNIQKDLKRHQQRNQQRNQQRDFSKKKSSYNDIPIIGQEPRVVRDIGRVDPRDTRNMSESSPFYQKKAYRTFGNQSEVKFVEKYEKQQKLIKGKKINSGGSLNSRSISGISAIQQNQNISESNTSLNKALFN